MMKDLLKRLLPHLVPVLAFAAVMVLMASDVALADALDDAATKFGSFLTRTGTYVTGFGVGAGTLALSGIGIRRMIAKSAGDEEVMARSNNSILEILKYAAIVAGSGVLAQIGGLVLK